MNYSNAVSRGISSNSQSHSKAREMTPSGNTGLYPKLPNAENDFPALPARGNGPTKATHRPAANYASATSSHTSAPGTHTEVCPNEYAGQSAQQGTAGLQDIGKTLEKSISTDRENISDFDYGPSDEYIDVGQKPHLSHAGVDHQNVTEQQVTNANSQCRSGPVDQISQHNRYPPQDNENHEQQRSLSKSGSKVDWNGRNQRQSGNSSQGYKGSHTQSQGDTEHQGNRSQGYTGSHTQSQGNAEQQDNRTQGYKGSHTQSQGNAEQQGNRSQGYTGSHTQSQGNAEQQGNRSQGYKGSHTQSQGNAEQQGNRSQGYKGQLPQTQRNDAQENWDSHDKNRSQGVKENQGKTQGNSFQQNQNKQEGNGANEYRGDSMKKKGYQSQKENFEAVGARPRDTRQGKHGGRHKWNGSAEGGTYGEEACEIDPVLREKYKDDNKFKFEFFWQSDCVYSQWHAKDFIVDGKTYMCAEQFMMNRKAVLFEDYRLARKIMETRNPRIQKKLGRAVANFDEALWQANCEAIVEEGNMAKFSQNDDLLNIICASNPKILVEASPMDRIWGIGLSSDDPRAWNRATWLGENKLGKVLTKVRNTLMLEKELITQEDYDKKLKELML